MLQCSNGKADLMPSKHSRQDQLSPFAALTELAVEGTSSLIEAQRALLQLAQEENDIILNGIKERFGNFVPAAAMTDLVRRSVDTVIEMQQELLTNSSRQTLQWLESEKAGKSDRTAHLVEVAREGVETFTRAQSKFLKAVAEESSRATSGKHDHDPNTTRKELTELAREAGNAFIDAQKRLLDIMGQQINANLEASTRAAEFVSPLKLVPMATLATTSVRDFVQAQGALIDSVIRPKKAGSVRKPAGHRAPKRKAVAV